MPTVPSRRERLRHETTEEIREHGYAQIAQGGPAALSLNGIAKAMGMSGPAMYRYFASRDALLTTLISESYEDLAASLATVLTGAGRRSPTARFGAVADAYRGWALAQPHRYRLIFESAGIGSGDPERIIPASQRAMNVILDALADLTPGAEAAAVKPASLAAELTRWGARSSHPGAEPNLFLAAQTAWTRLHGVVSLEIEGVYAQMGISPAAVYAHEVLAVVAQAATTAT